MKHWVKLDVNNKFITYESGTIHDNEEGWYEINNGELAEKILKNKYNSEFVFENERIVDVLGEEYTVIIEQEKDRLQQLEEQNQLLQQAMVELTMLIGGGV